jgi:coenzyme F420 hydrogenase subunit beta
MCPNNAIELNIVNGLYLPQVQETKCTSCGLCIKSCPGYIVDFSELSLSIFGKEYDCGLLGNYLGCYIGHSNDEYIRYNSSSGGLISQLLIFLLEEGMIDGALVVRMKKDKPLEAEPFIAKTREQIISASKSKYCPVPANMMLKEIMSHHGKFAVVGLPCHIHGIRKAEAVNEKLREKISLHLGLFCSHTVNFLGTKVLLEKFGIDARAVITLEYRGHGWPGNLSITLVNEQLVRSKRIDYRKECWNPLFSPFFFTPLRCMCCSDHTNELADLSFGDAWLKEILKKDKIGTSVVISRSEAGEEILKKAELKGKITLNKINYEKVIESQWTSLFFKKICLSSRMRILRSFGREMPKYHGVKQNVKCVMHIVSLLQLFDAFFSNRRIGIFALKYTPFQLMRMWSAFLYYLEVVSSRKYKV